MSKTFKDAPSSKQERRDPGRARRRGRQRSISVRAIRRDPPDLRKLSRALIQLALAEAEAAAAAQAEAATEHHGADAPTAAASAEEPHDAA